MLSRLWKISTSSFLVSWTATKTSITSVFMNDTMIGIGMTVKLPHLSVSVTGSVAGIVKIWELSALLRPQQVAKLF